VRVARLGTFGHTADPTLGELVLFLFVLLAVSALAPPARNHSAFVSFFFVADLLGWLFFFADFFVFIGYLLSPLCGFVFLQSGRSIISAALEHRSRKRANSACRAYTALAGDIFESFGGQKQAPV
jgi:hypothetical protein